MNFNLSVHATLQLFQSFSLFLRFGQPTAGAVLFEFLFWLFFVFLWFFWPFNLLFDNFDGCRWCWSSGCCGPCCRHFCCCRCYQFATLWRGPGCRWGWAEVVVVVVTVVSCLSEFESGWAAHCISCIAIRYSWKTTIINAPSELNSPSSESAEHFCTQFRLGLWKVEPVNLTSDSK